MRPIIFANLTTRSAATEVAPSASAYTFPPCVAGDTVGYAIRCFDVLGASSAIERQVGVRSLRASIGLIDAAPTGGSFTLKIGNLVSSADNTTAPISVNATAAEVEAALEAVPVTSVYDAVTVWKEGTSWLVEFAGASAAVPLSVQTNRLVPVSFVRILAQEVNGRWVHELRAVQAPVATTSEFERVLPAPPAVTVLKHGYVDEYELVPKKYPTVQRLFIGEAFRGLYSLRLGNLKTGLLDPQNDGIAAVQRELSAIMGDPVTVSNPGDGVALITFSGEKLNGTDVAALEVDVANTPPGDVSFELPLNSYELFVALRGKASLVLPFEVEADIVERVEDELNLAVAATRQTLWSTTITIKQELNWAGLEQHPQVDWLRPPQHESYIPFTADQVITGQQSYVCPLGDGVGTEFEVTHGLGTRNLHVALRTNDEVGTVVAGGHVVRVPSENVVVVSFDVMPSEEQYVLTVLAAGPKSAFQAHTHTIQQVVGLQAALTSLEATVAALAEASGGTPQTRLNLQPLGDPTFSIPDICELLPDGYAPVEGAIAGQIVAIRTGVAPTPPKFAVQAGSDEAMKAADQKAAQVASSVATEVAEKATAAAGALVAAFTIPRVDIAYPISGGIVSVDGSGVKLSPGALSLTRPPALLAAVRPMGGVISAAVLPEVVAAAGKVYLLTAGVTVPGYGGRRAYKVSAGGLVASDGRCFYQVVGNGDGYYPVECEKTLFTLPLEGAMLSTGRSLEVLVGLELGLANANVQARQTFIIEFAAPTAATGPVNGVATVPWTEVALTQGISITGLRTKHRFGVRVERNDSVLKVKVLRYGVWETATMALVGKQFMLRARLANFDCEDSADPRGVCVVGMPAVSAQIV